MIMWFSVVLTAFAGELIVGVNILKYFSMESNANLWHWFQLVFPMCLTIALLSQSVFGVPFLWIGLWKGGLPETSAYLLAARTHFGAHSKWSIACRTFRKMLEIFLALIVRGEVFFSSKYYIIEVIQCRAL